MDNIFKDAKFGYIYVTKDGHKNSFCSFTTSNGETIARLYREGWGVVHFYLDGRAHSGIEFGKGIDFTIVDRLKESIDNEVKQAIDKASEFLLEHFRDSMTPKEFEIFNSKFRNAMTENG